MRTARPDLLAAAALLAVLLLPAPASTGPQEQEVRPVVSSEIAVSSRDATLRIEVAAGERLEISLREGEVLLDGEALAGYERGDALDSAWRALLADAVELDGEALAAELVGWGPPGGLEGEAGQAATRIDGALEQLLTAPAPERPEPPAAAEAPEPRGDLRELLRRADRLAALAAAVDELSLDGIDVEVGRDVEVSPDEDLPGSLVVVDGDVEVRGRVRGDVVVVGGALRVVEGGRIDGEVRLADARLARTDGEIGGAVRHVPAEEVRLFSDLEELDDLRDRIRREVRSELRSEFRGRGGGSSLFAPLRHIGRGVVGLLRNVIGFVILAALGLAVLHFFPDPFERVADAARRSPGRAALVGGAGIFLLLPAYVLGAVALAVSVVGIPLLLGWIPLFPVAAGLAAGLGYLAVARLLGEWLAGRDLPGLATLRSTNAAHALFAGVALLLLPYAAANMVQMAGPWLGFLHGLLLMTGWLAAVLAVATGLGAVLLTRGGRQSFYAPGGEPFEGAPFAGPGETGGEADRRSGSSRPEREGPDGGGERDAGPAGGTEGG